LTVDRLRIGEHWWIRDKDRDDAEIDDAEIKR
jgi:hypothetical protein